jgi:SAM-dependent methyltransferase
MTDQPITFTALTDVASTEAAIWEKNSYYEDAENWTWLFWDDSHPFKPLFRQLDLTATAELACGYGRHAEHLLTNYSHELEHLTLIDILPSNVDHCRSRIGHRNDVTFLVNSGADFQPIAGSALTSIYCYDAMVHFNHMVVKSYLEDAFRVLRPGGKALFHHSNYSIDTNFHFGMNPHARAYMPVGRFHRYATEAGFEVCSQVTIPWGEVKELDCLTLLAKGS